MRTIQTCAGLGDVIWILMKLFSAKIRENNDKGESDIVDREIEKFHWQLPNGEPQRGKQVFDLLPQITASCTYVPRLDYKKLKRGNIQKYRPYWRKIRDKEFMLSANEHLEKGRRIEEFFPDLETVFTLPWVTSEDDKERARKYTADGKHIGIYGSSYKTSQEWKFWGADKWFEFIKLIHEQDPEFSFVLIGAEWDLDLVTDLAAMLDETEIKYTNSVGEPLSVVIEILKRLELFCGFPSGLSILNETIPGKSTLMFYPEHLEPMMNAWASPERIENGQYIPLLFCEPEAAYQTIRHLVEREDAAGIEGIKAAVGVIKDFGGFEKLSPADEKEKISLPSGQKVDIPKDVEGLTEVEKSVIGEALKQNDVEVDNSEPGDSHKGYTSVDNDRFDSRDKGRETDDEIPGTVKKTRKPRAKKK